MIDDQIFLQATNINKQFYGVYALKDVSLTCRKGEIIGLIGENGAGKSTLMKIVSGSYTKDSGEIVIDGEAIPSITPKLAKSLGINMVYQDSRLVPDLDVGQNIWLSDEKLNPLGFIDRKKQNDIAKGILSRFDIDINVHTLVRNLTVAQRQLVEIVKAISKETRLLILDEPTSSLTPREVNKLFEIIREISAAGTAVVFVSHRIQELLQICQSFVVLKDGKNVGGLQAEEATEDNLVSMMVGRDIDKTIEKTPIDYKNGHKKLEINNLTLEPFYRDISLDLYEGEILGLYGIEGNGQREILRSIMGLLPDYTGSIILEGKPYHAKTTRMAIDSGISFVTNDRHGENIFMRLSLLENITNPNLSTLSNKGIVNAETAKSQTEEALEQFSVKYDNIFQLARELSGGNQQKVAIAGRFVQRPKVFIFDEPTIGVDVGSKSEIYGILKVLAESGVAIIVLSSDLPEIIGISDRVIPVSNGQVQKAINKNDATEELVMSRSILGDRVSVSNESGTNGSLLAHMPDAGTPSEPLINNRRMGLGLLAGKWSSLIILVLIILLMGVIGSRYNNRFLVPYNVGLIMWQVIPLALVAMSQTFVTVSGAIDLSVGSLMSLTTCVLSYTLATDETILGGLASAVILGIICGLVNAFVVVKLNVQHFIGTLSTQIVLLGAALMLRHTASGQISPLLSTIIKSKIGRTWPVFFFVVVALTIILEIILQKRRFGTYLYAVGSDREAAFSTGIPVNRIRTLAYVFSGLFAALAGIILAVRVGSGDPQSGTTFTMQSLTAVVLGGISLSGGKGTFTGPFFGALLVATLQNFLNMMRVSAYWQYVLTGSLLLVAASIYYYSQKKSKKIIKTV